MAWILIRTRVLCLLQIILVICTRMYPQLPSLFLLLKVKTWSNIYPQFIIMIKSQKISFFSKKREKKHGLMLQQCMLESNFFPFFINLFIISIL